MEGKLVGGFMGPNVPPTGVELGVEVTAAGVDEGPSLGVDVEDGPVGGADSAACCGDSVGAAATTSVGDTIDGARVDDSLGIGGVGVGVGAKVSAAWVG